MSHLPAAAPAALPRTPAPSPPAPTPPAPPPNGALPPALLLLLALLAPLATFTTGCGYQMVGPQGLYRQDVTTVAVPVVANRTFYRADTGRLTNAISRQIEVRTPYRVGDRATADTILEVTITEVRLNTVARSRDTALPQQQIYSVLVDVEWKDLRTGRVLMRRENFEQTAVLYPTLGEGQFVVSQTAAEALAAGIVEEMTATW